MSAVKPPGLLFLQHQAKQTMHALVKLRTYFRLRQPVAWIQFITFSFGHFVRHSARQLTSPMPMSWH